MEGKNPYNEEPRGRGLFLRSVFCAFIILILCSVFALHTDFSERVKETFKSALSENSENLVSKALEAVMPHKQAEKPVGGYIPEGETESAAETYPNPIIMPSETAKTNGSVPFSGR